MTEDLPHFALVSDQYNAVLHGLPDDANMSSILVIIAFLFVVLLEHVARTVTVSPLCRKGVVKVRCDLSECLKTDLTARPSSGNKTYLDKLGLYLMKGRKVINKSESIRNVTFLVGFVNLHAESNASFDCIFKSNRTQICRQSIVIDLQSLPAPVQELSMSVSKSGNIFRMIVVKFNESARSSMETSTTARVKVTKYFIATESCSGTTTASHSLQKTGPCAKIGKAFVCSNLLKGSVYIPGKFAATAMVENHAGTCYSLPFCKELTYFDIYGGLKNVTVNFQAFHSSPRLNVSWQRPDGLENVVSSITFELKYCRVECSYQNEKRSLVNNHYTAKIYKDVSYNSTYTIQIRYIISEVLSSSKSPWTKPVTIRTPTKIPSISPKVIKCENTGKELTMWWRNENVEFYRLRIEVSGRKDSYLKFPKKDCRHSYCAFSWERSSSEKAYGIRVFPCSDRGCNKKSVSTCYFEAVQYTGKLQSPEKTWPSETGDILVLVLPFVGMIIVIIAFVMFNKIRQWWKSISSQYQYPVVGPRSYSDSASSELSTDHNDQCPPVYEKL